MNVQKSKLDIKNKALNFINGQKMHLLLCFGIPVVIMYLIYLVMEIHPFGDGSVLVLDLNAQYVYFYEALRDFVWGDNSLLYSFSRQLGGEFMGIYAYYIASPLSYIVALFPKEKILESLLCIFLIKTGLCGCTCGYYLSKITKKEKLSGVTVVIFSTMYALCSYAIVQQNNSMWIDALIWLPLLTYSIEQMIKYRKFKLYVVSLAFTIMSNFYIGYMVCIYVVLYFFYYYIAQSEYGRNNPLDEKTHFAKSLLRIIIYSIMAVGISAVIVLTAYYSLKFGKTTFSNPSWEFELNFDLMDYLTKFLPGSYDTVRRSGLPFVYCGVLALFMLPVYFISRKISNREKIMSGVMIVIFSLSFMVNVFDLVWHGFQAPNWLNYRYSFMLTFLLVAMAYKGFSSIEKVSGKVHFTTAAIITLFVVVAQKYTFQSYNKEKGAQLDPIQTIGFTLLCVAAYLIILGIYRTAKNKKSIGLVLAVVVCLEMFGNGLSNVVGLDNDVIYSKYSSYNDFIGEIRPIVDTVRDNDTSLYRMEKINHRRANDNMALGIKGLSGSSSTLNRETVTLLNNFGYASAAHKSSYYGGNPVNDSLLGVKYIVADNKAAGEKIVENDNIKSMLSRYYELYTSDDNYNVYYNPYALSFAFGVDDAIEDFEFKNEKDEVVYFTPYHKLNAIVSAMLGSKETLEIFKEIKDVEVTEANCNTGFIADHHKYTPKDSSSASYVIYDFVVQKTGDVYFYLPSLYSRQVELIINNKSYSSFYTEDTNRAMLIGNFEEGEKITVKVKLSKDVLYVKANVGCFYYLDDEVFESSMKSLAETQMVVDKYTDDHIEGKISTSLDNQTILTTIPYDEGWRVKIDGKEVEYSKSFDALISFNIEDAGSHEIEFVYRSDAFVYGMICTTFFVALFAVLIIFEKPVYKFIYTKIYDEDDFENKLQKKIESDGFELDENLISALPENDTKKFDD